MALRDAPSGNVTSDVEFLRLLADALDQLE